MVAPLPTSVECLLPQGDELTVRDAIQLLATIVTAHLVVFDPGDVDHTLGRIAQQAHRRRLVVAKLHGNSLDVESVLERQVHELDVECEPVDALEWKEEFGDVAAHRLQSTLCVEEAAGHQSTDDVGEESGRQRAFPRGCRGIRGTGQRPIAYDEMIAELANAPDHYRDEIEIVGQVDVREHPNDASRLLHPGTNGGTLSSVVRELNQPDATATGKRVPGKVAPTVIDEDDLPIADRAVQEHTETID